MLNPAFTCFRYDIRVFPIFLELPSSFYDSVFKNFSKDKYYDLEDSGSCLVVVMSSRSLLVVGHPDGRIFSYFIRLV